MFKIFQTTQLKPAGKLPQNQSAFETVEADTVVSWLHFALLFVFYC